MRLALALEGPQVVAQAVEAELAGDLALEPLAAGERLGIALEVGAAELERGVVAGRAVEADLETADDLAAEQAAADVAQRGEAVLDVQGRFQLRDLLAVQADAAEVQGTVDFQVPAVGFTPDVGKLALHVLQRQAGLDRIVVEDDQRMIPLAARRLAELPDQLSLRLPLTRKVFPSSSRRAKSAMTGGILSRSRLSSRKSCARRSETSSLNCTAVLDVDRAAGRT